MGYAIDGRSKCHDAQCKEVIHAKTLRIGKRAPAVKGHSARVQWFHAECIFNSFGRMSGSTKTITSLGDVERLEEVAPEDMWRIERLIRNHNAGLAPPAASGICQLAPPQVEPRRDTHVIAAARRLTGSLSLAGPPNLAGVERGGRDTLPLARASENTVLAPALRMRVNNDDDESARVLAASRAAVGDGRSASLSAADLTKLAIFVDTARSGAPAPVAAPQRKRKKPNNHGVPWPQHFGGAGAQWPSAKRSWTGTAYRDDGEDATARSAQVEWGDLKTEQTTSVAGRAAAGGASYSPGQENNLDLASRLTNRNSRERLAELVTGKRGACHAPCYVDGVRVGGGAFATGAGITLCTSDAEDDCAALMSDGDWQAALDVAEAWWSTADWFAREG